MRIFDKKLGGSLTKNSPADKIEYEKMGNADLISIARNLVANPGNINQTRQTNDGVPIPEPQDVAKMFSRTATTIKDARNILRSSPELCTGIDIYISGLLSPNAVAEPELNITCPEQIKLDPIKGQLLEVVNSWAKEEYKIDSRLKNWVFNSRFLSGSVPLAVVPLTEIDRIINEGNGVARNQALESYENANDYKNSGMLKTTNNIVGHGITYTRNENSKSIKRLLSLSLEDAEVDSVVTFNTTKGNNIRLALESAFNEDLGDKTNKQKTSKAVDTIVKALESVHIHDNMDAFKLGELRLANAKNIVRNKFSPLRNSTHTLAQESADGSVETKAKDYIDTSKYLSADGTALIYPQRTHVLQEAVQIRPTNIGENYGHPKIIELPADACYPVTPPGRPEQHILYIVPLDSSGVPLSASYYDEDEMTGAIGGVGAGGVDSMLQTGTGAMGTQMLTNLGMNTIDGAGNFREKAFMNSASNLFNAVLEADIRERLRNGIYGSVEMDFKFTDAFHGLMFQRALSGKQTQFLIIPSELMAYIAFELNELGIGESKLAKHRDIAIIASTVQIANALASINNASLHKKVTITFDDDEADAMDTAESLKSHIVNSSWGGRIFSSTNPNDQLNHIISNAFSFKYENTGGNFPGTSYDVEYVTHDIPVIDNEYLDTVNKRLILLSGVPAEIVDMSQDVEFAQSYITNHMLRAQQASVEQTIFCAGLDRFIQAFCLHSNIIITELRKVITNNAGTNGAIKIGRNENINDYIEEFIEGIRTSLPHPDTTKIDMTKDVIASHKEFIEVVNESFFDDPMFDSSAVGERLGDKKDLMRSMFKSAYIRRILQENNLIPPEFLMLLGSFDPETMKDPIVDSERVMTATMEYFETHEKSIMKLRKKLDSDLTATEERIDNQIEMGGGSTDGGSGESNSSTDDTPPTDDDNNDDTSDDTSTDASADDPDGLFNMGGDPLS